MLSSLAYYVTLLRKDFTGFCNQKLQELGLSYGLLFFVIYIGACPGCSPGALAEALHMDSGYVTRSLARLEQGGFVRQETNPDDRRGRILQLRERGEEAFHASHELFKRWDDEIMKDMPDKDRKRLLALIGGLTEGKERCCGPKSL